ncbi:hypothetical protein GXW71_29415 [Roseomonas hellenica]|uniref:Uncharacterized protein n=1 Tax=Plastoroseomonas hellenica TaxID=2687306 RepID=A0ABS5F7F8_9PROT|nr:Wadjet anti-phage system protein JetA family protein [Plastoroseomonas hellenica]MBR0668508.1 hypothetical protein [Plastoroseomonas hellenica]
MLHAQSQPSMSETESSQGSGPAGCGHLFGHLPPDLFRLLSGAARWFYAELLEHLNDELFAVAAAAVTQREAIASIAEFIERRGRGVEIEADAGEAIGAAATSEQRAQVAYRRLVATGWLVEHRDRYRRLLDLDGHGRLLLELLIDIRKGRTRSYGGEVLLVLTMIEAARSKPAERSESIRNAAKSARSFLHHLRSVSGAMRRIEQEIASQTELAPLFRRFFDDFVQNHLIEDYKRLHTQTNPFRFRVRIIEEAEAILADPLTLDDLADAYVLEGRAPDRAEGRMIITVELQQVVKVFEALDEHLDLIEDTNRRVERRVRNTVRHMERIMDANTEAVVAALEALGKHEGQDVPTASLPFMPETVPTGPNHLYQSARRRSPPERMPVRRPQPDPAFLAFQAALRDYRGRMAISSIQIRRYLERAVIGDRVTAAEDLPLQTLDDFAVFERLRVLPWLEGGALAGEYMVDTLPDAIFENEWITCPAFRIRRRSKEDALA